MPSNKVSGRAYMIDTIGAGDSSTVAVYVVRGARKTALVDCGFASSYGNILRGLRDLGVEPSKVDYLIPTHVHLDHAGGAGHLIKYMPKAKVIAHEKAAPHLVDPTKLVEGASALFGPKLVEMYGKPVPIDKNRVQAVGEESHLDLGGASLTTLYAPGHAPHQISVFYEEEHLLFSADAVGIILPAFPTLLPTTPPPSLDPVKLGQTLERFRQMDPKMLLVPHFGVRKDVGLVLDRTKEETDRWIAEIRALNDRHVPQEQVVAEVRRRISAETGMPIAMFPGFVNVMVRISILGILGYLNRASAGPPTARS